MYFFAKNLKETKKFAKILKNLILKNKVNNVIVLSGELGSGKTTLIKFLLRTFAIRDRIFSPTFILWQKFQLKNKNLTFHHIDCYRLENVNSLLKLGFANYLKNKNNFFLIEWGEKMLKYLEENKIKYTQLNIINLLRKKRFFYLINH